MLPELQTIFPDIGLCEAVVAENGAVVYWPGENRETILSEPPPDAFVAEMTRLEVAPFSVGKAIFATWRPHEGAVLEVIQRLGIEYHIIFNKDAVMALPTKVTKATGLAHVLQEMEIDASQVVGIGDAENDHAFLDACGVSAAVANALPAVQARCDMVTSHTHGAGVSELIDRMLADDLRSLGSRQPRTLQQQRTIETP
jgi:hydroxymethylpyrimidine pyrophosphatase-like HAD family hydrolase